jgi:NDP-sugar pyrophosphorylase family protein
VLEFREKPTWEQVVVNTVNAGIYIVDPSIFKDVPKGKPHSFERQLYPQLLEKKERVYGYKTDAYWMDIGDPAKYLQAHHDILNGYVMANIPGNRLTGNVWIGDKVKISKSAKVRGNVLVGNGCEIAEDVSIEESVTLGDGVIISKGAKLKNTVIHGHTTIGENCRTDGAIIGNHCTIEEFCAVGQGTVLADGTILKKGTKAGAVS